jgi:hypothetical protein
MKDADGKPMKIGSTVWFPSQYGRVSLKKGILFKVNKIKVTIGTLSGERVYKYPEQVIQVDG